MEKMEDMSIAVMINNQAKRIGIILPVPGEEDELVIDLSISQARAIERALSKAIDELEGRKEVIH